MEHSGRQALSAPHISRRLRCLAQLSARLTRLRLPRQVPSLRPKPLRIYPQIRFTSPGRQLLIPSYQTLPYKLENCSCHKRPTWRSIAQSTLAQTTAGDGAAKDVILVETVGTARRRVAATPEIHSRRSGRGLPSLSAPPLNRRRTMYGFGGQPHLQGQDFSHQLITGPTCHIIPLTLYQQDLGGA